MSDVLFFPCRNWSQEKEKTKNKQTNLKQNQTKAKAKTERCLLISFIILWLIHIFIFYLHFKNPLASNAKFHDILKIAVLLYTDIDGIWLFE